MLLCGIGYPILFILSGFIVYFWRVVYSPEWLSQIKYTFILFVILSAIYTSVWLAKKLSKGNTAMFMACLIFIAGLIFAFVNPPNQVPDEQTHFLRSYAIAMGDFHFDKNQSWPNDVNLLIEHFPVAHNNGYPAKVGNTVYNRFTEYFTALEKGDTAPDHNIIIFQTIPYLPQALGIFIARIFGLGALGAYYLGRITNLLFYSLCCYFALATAKRFNVLMFTIMALPLTIFIAASNSNDSMLFGLMFVVFATVLSEDFNRKMLFIFCVSMAVLCVSKTSYIVFFLLLLAIDPQRWSLKLRRWQIVLISFAAFLAVREIMSMYVLVASNYDPIPRTMPDSDPLKQLLFILSNPLRYIVVVLDTLKNNSFFLFSGGLLGWLDADLRLVSYLTPVVVLLNSAKQGYSLDKKDTKATCIFAVCSFLTYCVVLTGLYISWTPVTLPQIIGLQMRYFIPAFFGLAMIIAHYFSKYMKGVNESFSNVKSCIYTSFSLCLLAAVLLFMEYYLPVKVIAYVS